MIPIESQLKNISNDPGVYLFKNKQGIVIYIGKAVNLKSRVRSYWNKTTWKDRPKLGALVPKVEKIETIITKSEKEALILEANLVFKHQPRYNVLLKANNKKFPWLVITYDESYPRLIPVRDIDSFKSRSRTKASKNKFFGPYTNVSAMYENLNLVNELFPLRKKRVPPFRDRPCLNYDLGKCLGPCQKLISEEDYRLMLEQVELLLNGDYKDLESILRKEMERYSDNLEYEKAAKARDRINALKIFNEVQNVITDDTNLEQDIFTLEIDSSRDLAIIQVFTVRGGRMINRDTTELDFQKEDEDIEIFISSFEQYYSQVPDDNLPKEILVNYDSEKLELFADWLSERKGQKLRILKPQRGEKYAQLALAKRNARVLIEKIKLEHLEQASKDINIALENLAKALDLRSIPERIECCDISHLQGTATVASIVCFIEGMPAKEEYRRYKISVDQNDDFASMNEVIKRRFSRAQAKPNDNQLDDQSHLDNVDSLPTLLIIDGGKGQLNAAIAAMKDKGMEHIRVVGLAKKEEEIFLPNDPRPIILDRKSPELFLVQRIRNEAHRFAITYHRQLRSKRSFKTKLEDIPGLGQKKKDLLLKNYPTLTKLLEASIDDISKLRGFNQELATKIKDCVETIKKSKSEQA
jgi:excinuclease ABC subunit C